MAGLAAAGSARAMGAIVRGFDTRYVCDITLQVISILYSFSSVFAVLMINNASPPLPIKRVYFILFFL